MSTCSTLLATAGWGASDRDAAPLAARGPASAGTSRRSAWRWAPGPTSYPALALLVQVALLVVAVSSPATASCASESSRSTPGPGGGPPALRLLVMRRSAAAGPAQGLFRGQVALAESLEMLGWKLVEADSTIRTNNVLADLRTALHNPGLYLSASDAIVFLEPSACHLQVRSWH